MPGLALGSLQLGLDTGEARLTSMSRSPPTRFARWQQSTPRKEQRLAQSQFLGYHRCRLPTGLPVSHRLQFEGPVKLPSRSLQGFLLRVVHTSRSQSLSPSFRGNPSFQFSVGKWELVDFQPLGRTSLFGRIGSPPPKGGTPYPRGRLVPLAPLVVKEVRRRASGVGLQGSKRPSRSFSAPQRGKHLKTSSRGTRGWPS